MKHPTVFTRIFRFGGLLLHVLVFASVACLIGVTALWVGSRAVEALGEIGAPLTLAALKESAGWSLVTLGIGLHAVMYIRLVVSGIRDEWKTLQA